MSEQERRGLRPLVNLHLFHPSLPGAVHIKRPKPLPQSPFDVSPRIRTNLLTHQVCFKTTPHNPSSPSPRHLAPPVPGPPREGGHLQSVDTETTAASSPSLFERCRRRRRDKGSVRPASYLMLSGTNTAGQGDTRGQLCSKTVVVV